MLTDRKKKPMCARSGRRDRGAADVRQEGAGPVGGGQPETAEGCERGETRQPVDGQQTTTTCVCVAGTKSLF